MKTKKLTITDTAWTEILADGGNAIMSDVSGPIFLAMDAQEPTSTADAHGLEPHAFSPYLSVLSVPSGTKLFVRPQRGDVTLVVTK